MERIFGFDAARGGPDVAPFLQTRAVARAARLPASETLNRRGFAMITTCFHGRPRAVLGTLAFGFGATALAARGAFAEELTRTPTTNEGPYYPTKLPLDTDNDLLLINDAITPAVGEITHLSGRLLDARG